MTKRLTAQTHYDIAARRISGTRDEKLAEIDEAIQELLDIKLLECASDRPGVRFIAVPRRTHWFAMTVTLLVLFVLLMLLGVRAAHAQTPAAAPAASDDAVWTHVKFGAALEGYYQYDWNKPPDRTIPLRAYDVRSDSFSIQQVALIVDAQPDPERHQRFGLRVDLQFGQATDALQGSAVNEPRPDIYRQVWQAYGTYVFPVGRGLQVDFGKFASNLGYETNYAKDDVNFSRALLFNFLPYYHSGLRTTLPVSEKLTLMYMLTNGIQQTEDFNNYKSNHFTAIVKPIAAMSWTASYYFGREQPDGGMPGGPDGWFRAVDINGTIAASSALTFAFDVTHVTNQLQSADPSTALVGVGAYARQQITPAIALAARYEHLDDEGLFADLAQKLQEATVTTEYKLAEGFLVRGEFRRDWSNRTFFALADGHSRHQNSALVGLVWWIGNKTGSW